jgi:hypothetical protein
MPEGCPWSGWTPPNVNWCEEELCAWVTNPADTWSNLAYVVLGLWMMQESRRHAGSGGPNLAVFGPASILVGVFSGIYHASYTYFLQFFDFVGMFVFCFTVISENAVRLAWVGPARKIPFFVVGVVLFSALVPLLTELGVAIQPLVAVLIALGLGQELALCRRARESGRPIAYQSYWVGLGFLAAGGVCSLLDVTRVWCDPTNHWLQGHATWHILTAIALFAFFRFYASLETRAA